MRAAVAEARQLGGVRVAQHASQGPGAGPGPSDATVWVALEEAVDAEAGAERARRREAEESGEPGDEVGEDAVGEEKRDEDPLQQRVREHPRDAVALLAQRRREVGAGHGCLRHHPRSPARGNRRNATERDADLAAGLCRGIQESTKQCLSPESRLRRHKLDWSGAEPENAIQARFFTL